MPVFVNNIWLPAAVGFSDSNPEYTECVNLINAYLLNALDKSPISKQMRRLLADIQPRRIPITAILNQDVVVLIFLTALSIGFIHQLNRLNRCLIHKPFRKARGPRVYYMHLDIREL